MEAKVHTIFVLLEQSTVAMDAIGACVMLIGFCIAVFKFFKTQIFAFRKKMGFWTMQNIRVELGSYLLLGLELMIVGDIIHTILKPDWFELIYLIIIVLIRTTIAYFLGKEVEAIEKVQQQHKT